MAIPNPLDDATKAVKKIPKKAWIVAIAGGLIIGFIVLQRRSNEATDMEGEAAADDYSAQGYPDDMVSYEPSPSYTPATLGAPVSGGGAGYDIPEFPGWPEIPEFPEWPTPLEGVTPVIDEAPTNPAVPPFTINITNTAPLGEPPVDRPVSIPKPVPNPPGSSVPQPKPGTKPKPNETPSGIFIGSKPVNPANTLAGGNTGTIRNAPVKTVVGKGPTGGGAPNRPNPGKAHTGPAKSPAKGKPQKNTPVQNTPPKNKKKPPAKAGVFG